MVTARQSHGKRLSYNNLSDGAAALELVAELAEWFPDRACAAVIKHANPCGAAVADTVAQAAEGALAGDPQAAYGGILAVSQPLDEETARIVSSERNFLELIIAPQFDDSAHQALAERWAMAVAILSRASLIWSAHANAIVYPFMFLSIRFLVLCHFQGSSQRFPDFSNNIWII